MYRTIDTLRDIDSAKVQAAIPSLYGKIDTLRDIGRELENISIEDNTEPEDVILQWVECFNNGLAAMVSTIIEINNIFDDLIEV